MLLQILTIAGIAVFAASGAVLGVRKDFDLWGILTVAILTGVGGGILRDLLLGVTPPTSLQTWQPVATAAIAGVVVFFFHPAFTELRRTILVLDAFGMGLFATTGASVAVGLHASALASVLVGMLTAIGGGVIRDVLVNEVPLLLQPADLYAVPALVGAGVYVAGHAMFPSAHGVVLVVGAAMATTLRLCGLAFRWRLPVAPRRSTVWPTLRLPRRRAGKRSGEVDS